MTDIFVDFSSVKADEFSVVPAGEYDATIVKATVRKKDDPNKETYPYINYQMKIDEGQEYAGASLFFISSLSTNGNNPPINRAKFILQSLGIDLSKDGETKLSVGPDGSLLEPNVVGLPCHCWVRHEQYQGQPQARVFRMRGPHPVSGEERSEAAAENRYA